MTPAELLIRKTEAYRGRRYIRDLFDIFQLVNQLDKKDHRVSGALKDFLKDIQKPIDERILASLVYKGPANLKFKDMVEYLNRWVK